MIPDPQSSALGMIRRDLDCAGIQLLQFLKVYLGLQNELGRFFRGFGEQGAVVT